MAGAALRTRAAADEENVELSNPFFKYEASSQAAKGRNSEDGDDGGKETHAAWISSVSATSQTPPPSSRPPLIAGHYGRLTMADGGYIEAEWVDGEICGRGTRVWRTARCGGGGGGSGGRGAGSSSSGGGGPATAAAAAAADDIAAIYEGDFQSGEMHGEGTLRLLGRPGCPLGGGRYAGGGTYTGGFVRNRFEGPRGRFEFAGGGGVFEGAFEGHRMASGRLEAPTGDVFVGQFRDGAPSFGVLTLARLGIAYEGAFVGGRPEVLPTKLNAYFLAAAPAAAAGEAQAVAQQPPPPAAAAARAPHPASGGKRAAAGAKAASDTQQQQQPLHASDGGKQAFAAAAVPDWAQAEPAAALHATAGAPLPVELTVAAQDAPPPPPAAAAAAATAASDSCEGACAPPTPAPRPSSSAGAGGAAATAAAGSGSGSSSGGRGGGSRPTSAVGGAAAGGFAVPPVSAAASASAARPTYFELPPGGQRWRTAGTESGRRVLLTLQRRPPAPLAPGRALSVLLCCVQQGDADDGNTEGGGGQKTAAVRVLLHLSFEVQMGRAEPMNLAAAAPPAAAGTDAAAAALPPLAAAERLTGLPLVLARGRRELRAFALGACAPTGACWLVLSSPGLAPGVVPLVIAAPPQQAAMLPEPGMPGGGRTARTGGV